MTPRDDYALRKAQLVAQCDLERMRLQFTLRTMRATLTAPVPTQPTVWATPVAATLLSFALPTLGVQRVKGVLELLSMALAAYRAVQHWQPRSSPPPQATAPAPAPAENTSQKGL